MITYNKLMAPETDVRKMAIASYKIQAFTMVSKVGVRQIQYSSLGHTVLIKRHFSLGNINVSISFLEFYLINNLQHHLPMRRDLARSVGRTFSCDL